MSEKAPAMSSHRPYLLRALYEWIADNGMTPQILVDAGVSGVRVPPHTVKDGRVVLNIADRAVARLHMDNEGISFSARFGGVSQPIEVPMAAIVAIYARETGHGMVLPEDPVGEADDEADQIADAGEGPVETGTQPPADDGPDDDDPAPPRRGGHLRIVK